MTKTTRTTYMPYPKEQALRVGCKVSWHYYDAREDADTAAIAAKHNAAIDRGLGYDHGYCSPGSVSWAKPGQWKQAGDKGRWEVCVP